MTTEHSLQQQIKHNSRIATAISVVRWALFFTIGAVTALIVQGLLA